MSRPASARLGPASDAERPMSVRAAPATRAQPDGPAANSVKRVSRPVSAMKPTTSNLVGGALTGSMRFVRPASAAPTPQDAPHVYDELTQIMVLANVESPVFLSR